MSTILARTLFAGVMPFLLITHREAANNQPLPPGYRVSRAFQLAASLHGPDGQIELLGDDRITPAIHARFWSQEPLCPPAAGMGQEWVCDPTNVHPLRNARVRVVNAAGRVVGSVTLPAPLAELEIDTLDTTGRPSFLVSTDMTAGMGSYNGPATEIADLRGGNIEWQSALDIDTGKRGPIILARTLKTGWHTVARRDGARGKDMLTIACRPDFVEHANRDSVSFQVTLTRYTYTTAGWERRTRTMPGYWEADDDFPASAAFP